MKRGDLFLMMAITYTNVIPDERAKLLWYTFVSGAMLALHSHCKPFDQRQCGLIDAAESFALAIRFVNFVMIAALLLFDAPLVVAWGIGGVVLAANCFFVAYTAHT